MRTILIIVMAGLSVASCTGVPKEPAEASALRLALVTHLSHCPETKNLEHVLPRRGAPITSEIKAVFSNLSLTLVEVEEIEDGRLDFVQLLSDWEESDNELEFTIYHVENQEHFDHYFALERDQAGWKVVRDTNWEEMFPPIRCDYGYLDDMEK